MRLGRAAALALLPLLLAAPALAHADLLGADPAPYSTLDRAPTELVLHFSEPVEDRFTDVHVFDANHTDYAIDTEVLPGRADVRVPLRPAPDGVLTVRWRALSVDTHTTNGLYLLGINATLDPTAPAAVDHAVHAGGYGAGSWAESATRAAAFAGAVLAAGVPATALALARSTPEPRRRTLTAIAATAGLAAAGASLILANLVAGRIEADLAGFFDTRTGQLMRLRVAVHAAAGLLLVAAWRWPRFGHDWLAAAVVGGAAALLLTSLTGHAAATEPAVLGVAVDWGHLLAASWWIGGIATVATLAAGHPDTGQLQAAIRRFHPTALAAVVVIVATGTWATFERLDRVADLATTLYGRALLVKIGLLIPLVILGAYHGRRVPNRLHEAPTLPRLRRSLAADVAIMAVVLAAAGVLATTAPPASILDPPEPAGPDPTVHTFSAEGYHVIVAIQPQPVRVGFQNLTVTVHPPPEGLPANFAVYATTWPPSDPHGEGTVRRLATADSTTWSAAGPLFVEPGAWRVQILLQGRATYVRDTFALDVAP